MWSDRNSTDPKERIVPELAEGVKDTNGDVGDGADIRKSRGTSFPDVVSTSTW